MLQTLLKSFRKFFKVILSLNHNEADLVASALGITHSPSDESFIESLYTACGTDILVIHRTNDAIGFDGTNVESFNTFFCKYPVILTGGGDNFNAGFCLGQLRGFDLHASLVVANAVSGYYVKTGKSPSVDQLISFLNETI